MKCIKCGKEEYQGSTENGKKKIKHPEGVTAIICSNCISEDLTDSRRRKE